MSLVASITDPLGLSSLVLDQEREEDFFDSFLFSVLIGSMFSLELEGLKSN